MRLDKALRSVLLAAPVAALITLPAAADTVVGMAGPITGPDAVFGKQMRMGAEMAVADINAKGGVLGQKLRLVLGDDASNPSQGVAVANKMATDGAVAVMGHFNSGVSIPASRVYADEGILQISPGSTNPQLTEQGFDTVFRTCGRDDQQGAVAAAYLAQNHAKDKIAFVNDQTTYGKGLVDATKAALNAKGVKETLYDVVTKGDRDMSALVTKMKDAGIQVVYFGGLHTEAGLLVRQMREKGLNAQLVSGDGIANHEFWNIAGPTAEGTLMTFGADARTRPEAADVVARFKAQGFDPEAYTLYTYAAVQAWAQAAQKARSTDAAKVAKALRDGEVDTVMGKLSFDTKGDRKQTDYVFYRWSNGSYTQVK
jgi:branched-chain amino acid transport system substrate-binding protein